MSDMKNNPEGSHRCSAFCSLFPLRCQQNQEFLQEPVARYGYSRRDLLRVTLVGGVGLATFPLFEEDAHADIFKPSASDQIKLGNDAAKQVLDKYKEVNDSRAREFTRVGNKLVDALSKKDQGPWEYKFRMIESKEINAFALPGGNMFMFTGLMDRMRSASELAAVTGHEMTHVRKEHWANAYAGQQKRALGVGLLLGVTRANSAVQALAGGLEQLYSLKFSRGEEDQADAGGLQNMVAAGFDPHGMLDLFKTLQKASGGKSGGPEFLSDHPLTSARVKNTEERIRAIRQNG